MPPMLDPVREPRSQNIAEGIGPGAEDSHGHHDPVGNQPPELSGDRRTQSMPGHDHMIDVQLMQQVSQIGDVTLDPSRRRQAPGRSPTPEVRRDERGSRRHPTHHGVPRSSVHRAVVEQEDGGGGLLHLAPNPDEGATPVEFDLDETPIIHAIPHVVTVANVMPR